MVKHGAQEAFLKAPALSGMEVASHGVTMPIFSRPYLKCLLFFAKIISNSRYLTTHPEAGRQGLEESASKSLPWW
jgi:hypothetical protein